MRVTRYRPVVTTVFALAMSAACSAIETGDIALRPHIRESDGPGARAPTIPTGQRGDTGTVGAAIPSQGTTVRRVCRTSGWPRDWVATAYENATGECPVGSGRDSSGVAAIIIRLSPQPLGTVLDICADQALPRGWEPVRIDDAEGAQRCPGAGADGASAIRRIRRIR